MISANAKLLPVLQLPNNSRECNVQSRQKRWPPSTNLSTIISVSAFYGGSNFAISSSVHVCSSWKVVVTLPAMTEVNFACHLTYYGSVFGNCFVGFLLKCRTENAIIKWSWTKLNRSVLSIGPVLLVMFGFFFISMCSNLRIANRPVIVMIMIDMIAPHEVLTLSRPRRLKAGIGAPNMSKFLMNSGNANFIFKRS